MKPPTTPEPLRRPVVDEPAPDADRAAEPAPDDLQLPPLDTQTRFVPRELLGLPRPEEPQAG